MGNVPGIEDISKRGISWYETFYIRYVINRVAVLFIGNNDNVGMISILKAVVACDIETVAVNADCV